MILIGSDFDESDFIAFLDQETHVFQRLHDGLGKGFSPVFHRTDQVVQ